MSCKIGGVKCIEHGHVRSRPGPSSSISNLPSKEKCKNLRQKYTILYNICMGISQNELVLKSLDWCDLCYIMYQQIN